MPIFLIDTPANAMRQNKIKQPRLLMNSSGVAFLTRSGNFMADHPQSDALNLS